MPIRRGAISCSRFRIDGKPPKDVRRWVTKALTARAFEPIDPKGDDDRAAGFVEFERHDGTDFEPGAVFDGEFALFAWRVEKLRVAPAALRAELLQWSQAFEAKNGRAPGRREKGDQKDVIRKALRAKAEPSTKVSDVSWQLNDGELLVWSTARAVIEEVQVALEEGLELRLVPKVPASLASADMLDTLSPTPELFGPELPLRPEVT